MIRKTAIIIGASSDIGKETAKEMAKSGYNLALTYNSNDFDTDFLAESELKNIYVKTYKLDLKNGEEILNFFKKLPEDFKTFDSLIFCAGISQKRKIIFDVTDQEIDDLFDINIKSAIKCVREFVKIVIDKNEASIVLVGSFVEKNGCSCESVYASTKSAMSGLCRSLACELGNFGIRINVVAPGFIDTKMNNNLSTAEKEDISSMTPLQRLGTTKDVSKAISYLATDSSSYVTGQTICIDGGLVLQ